MLLSEFKKLLEGVTSLEFMKSDGTKIPKHVHITEVGQVEKRFIDCGGTIRHEKLVSMQLWQSIDYWHRLEPGKLLSIIDLSIHKLSIEDHEVEIEYQGDTIGRYALSFKDGVFVLEPTQTACLATDQCGIPSLSDLKEQASNCCKPGSGCC